MNQFQIEAHARAADPPHLRGVEVVARAGDHYHDSIKIIPGSWCHSLDHPGDMEACIRERVLCGDTKTLYTAYKIHGEGQYGFLSCVTCTAFIRISSISNALLQQIITEQAREKTNIVGRTQRLVHKQTLILTFRNNHVVPGAAQHSHWRKGEWHSEDEWREQAYAWRVHQMVDHPLRNNMVYAHNSGMPKALKSSHPQNKTRYEKSLRSSIASR